MGRQEGAMEAYLRRKGAAAGPSARAGGGGGDENVSPAGASGGVSGSEWGSVQVDLHREEMRAAKEFNDSMQALFREKMSAGPADVRVRRVDKLGWKKEVALETGKVEALIQATAAKQERLNEIKRQVQDSIETEARVLRAKMDAQLDASLIGDLAQALSPGGWAVGKGETPSASAGGLTPPPWGGEAGTPLRTPSAAGGEDPAARAQERAASLVRSHRELEVENEALRKALGEVRADLARAGGSPGGRDLEARRGGVLDAQLREAEWKGKAEDAGRRGDEARAEAEEARAEADLARAEAEDAEARSQEARAEAEAAREAMEEARAEAEKLRGLKDDVELLRRGDEGEMQELRKAAASRLRECEAARREVEVAKSDAERAEARVAELERAAEREAAERRRHDSESEGLRSEAEELRAEVATLRAQAEKYTGVFEVERQELKGRLDSAAEREAQLVADVQQAKTDGERAAKEARAEGEAREAALQGETEAASREAEECRADASAARSELEAARGELDAARGELEATKGELEAARGELEATKGELEAARGELEAARGKLEATEGELEAARGELEAFKGEMEANSSALLREGLRRRDMALASLVDALGVRGRARESEAGAGSDEDDGSGAGSEGPMSPTTAAEVMVGDYETVRARVMELVAMQEKVEEVEKRMQVVMDEALQGQRRADEAEQRAARAQAEAEEAADKVEEAQADVAATELSYRAKEEERAEVAAQLKVALADLEEARAEAARARAEGGDGEVKVQAGTHAGDIEGSMSAEDITEVRAKLALLKAERDRLEGLLESANSAAAESEAAMEDVQAQYLRRLDEASEEKRLAFLESQKLREEIRLLREDRRAVPSQESSSPPGSSPAKGPMAAAELQTGVGSGESQAMQVDRGAEVPKTPRPSAGSSVGDAERSGGAISPGGRPSTPLTARSVPSVDEEILVEGDEGVVAEDSIISGSIIEEESAMYADDDFEDESAPSSPQFTAPPVRQGAGSPDQLPQFPGPQKTDTPGSLSDLAAIALERKPPSTLPSLNLNSRQPPPPSGVDAKSVEAGGEDDELEDEDDDVASLENEKSGIRTDRSFVSVRSLAQEGSFVSDVSRDLTEYEGYDLVEEVSRPQVGGPFPASEAHGSGKGGLENGALSGEDEDGDEAEALDADEDASGPDSSRGPSWDTRQRSIMAGSVGAWQASGEPQEATRGGFLDLPEAHGPDKEELENGAISGEDEDGDEAEALDAEALDGDEDASGPDSSRGPSWDTRQRSIMAGSVGAWQAFGEPQEATPGGFLDLPEAREESDVEEEDDDDGYSPYVPDAVDASRGRGAYDFGMSVSEDEMEMSDADSEGDFELPGI